MAVIIKSGNSSAEANASANGSLQVLPYAQFNTTPPSPGNGTEVAPQSDSAGSLYINAEGRKATYRAFVSGGTATTGILVGFYPNATKTIRITKILIFGAQTTAAIISIELEKCSTLDTGGTPGGTVKGPIPLDSSDPASNVTIKNYSAVPTTGTVITQLDQVEGLLHAATTIPTFQQSMLFGLHPGTKALKLTGTECVHLITGNTFGGGQFFNTVWEWTEE